MTRPLRLRYWLAPTQTHLEPAMPTQGKPTVFVRAVSEGETSELFIQGERIAVAGPMSAEEVAAWFNERYGWAAEFRVQSSASFVIEPSDGLFTKQAERDPGAVTFAIDQCLESAK